MRRLVDRWSVWIVTKLFPDTYGVTEALQDLREGDAAQKLRYLADLEDIRDTQRKRAGETVAHEVQDDLRRWADAIERLLK